MSPNSAHATSLASLDTTSTLADLHVLDRSIARLYHWLKVTSPLASDAPPKLKGRAQRKLIAISNMHAQKESKRDQVRTELFGAASGHDGHVTESGVGEDGQSSDDDSGASSDDDSGARQQHTQDQLLPVRRRVSPPLEHCEYRVMSPPPTFPQNWALARSSLGQPSHVPKHSGQAPRNDDARQSARTEVSTIGQFASSRQTTNTARQGAALCRNNHLRYGAPSGRADHVSAPTATTGHRTLPRGQLCTHAAVTDNQRGKKIALEVKEVEEEEVKEELRKRHAANKKNAAVHRSKHDDEELVPERPRPKRSRCNPVRLSFCYPSRHVENRDQVHAADVANMPTAAPTVVVAPLAPATAAPVAAPGLAVITPTAQLA
ncbi:uncharacterized protein PHACADRAFT_202055 [Phanerochaete carnosa HHB-10118-sp]|uniref:Uncharacterized protein n=1 Tax=Phanerochaete carnosa (strain HHB-10118-sp) TaxID=650164 RepID=K5VD54_PHACS|nr:uncharacterized protein PHACADRAFT_202055 [Phanerochaete carnosa HHB-10118-sp]EKM49063.1 hypothetical protein PHACADRAFT_202055 [Phanerochaete carnosa HHB-10118-sp]